MGSDAVDKKWWIGNSDTDPLLPAVEPPEWSFVVANLHDCSDRTVWEHDGESWFCLCCGGRAQWEHLVDPVDTICPEGYVNGAWNLISGDKWPLASQ